MVCEPISKTQHELTQIQVFAAIKISTLRRKFNNKKKWKDIAEDLDTTVLNLSLTPEKYNTYLKIMKKVSRRHIPREL